MRCQAQPTILTNHGDLGKSCLRNQDRLPLMRFCGSTDPNSFYAPEPNVLSPERELGTDLLKSSLFGGSGDFKLRGQFFVTAGQQGSP